MYEYTACSNLRSSHDNLVIKALCTIFIKQNNLMSGGNFKECCDANSTGDISVCLPTCTLKFHSNRMTLYSTHLNQN